LTSAWIQSHPHDFEPFLPGMDIKQYCSTEIEPSICELDHIGLTALSDVLLKPAGIALEVSYLDRSAGEEMNMYALAPQDRLPQDVKTIRLLYRP
jgi:ubiquitin thioesterase protein OTUB1